MFYKTILSLVLTILFAANFFIAYSQFYVMLSDDIEFNIGKKTLRNQRKKYKGFWKKFLFLDFKQSVKKWHYALFVCYLISYPTSMILMVLLIFFETHVFKILLLFFGIICFVSLTITSFVRYGLYSGNKVRSRSRDKWK